MVEWPQNHRKTIESNGLGGENQLMVMVEDPQNHPKTIDANGSCKNKYYHPTASKTNKDPQALR